MAFFWGIVAAIATMIALPIINGNLKMRRFANEFDMPPVKRRVWRLYIREYQAELGRALDWQEMKLLGVSCAAMDMDIAIQVDAGLLALREAMNHTALKVERMNAELDAFEQSQKRARENAGKPSGPSYFGD